MKIKKNVPKVSVLLPNLNTFPFLEERVQSIFDQTLTDWELIIVDNYSDDGAWEFFRELTAREPRIRLSQAPREGMYVNWNNCVKLARGEYVYIATSDDTMMPDCLEKMVSALDAHPECDLCHVCLKLIDETGQELPNSWRHFLAGQFYGPLLDRRHIRFAPHDGILYCGLRMIYTSITQLLIRRSVFEKVGLFRADWGSIGDFEWEMRATFACNTYHLPETLATWRRHTHQASSEMFFETAQHRAMLCEMIQAALPTLQQSFPETYKKIRLRRLLFPYRRQYVVLGMKERVLWWKKLVFILQWSFISPRSVVEFLNRRFLGKLPAIDNKEYICRELRRLGIEHHIKILE